MFNEDNLKKAITPDQLKDQIEPDPQIRALRAKILEYESTIKRLRLDEGTIKNLASEIANNVVLLTPYKQLYEIPKDRVGGESSAVFHLTDIHFGEHQDADEVESFGGYSREIARERILNSLLPKGIRWVDDHRKNNTIHEAVVLITGDLISGDIHHELSVTNEVPCPVQTAEVGFLIAEFLRQLAAHFRKVRVEFVTADNHSRLTEKYQYKEAGYNSYNYLAGVIIEQAVSQIDNIEFNLYPMLQTVVKVQRKAYLIFHGHTIKGWAGFPYYGMDRKAGKEAVRRMQRSSAADMDDPEKIQRMWQKHRFDKIVMGHFHAPLNSPWWMVGGSVSGASALDQGQGRYAPPSQTTWLVHENGGEYDWTAWDLWKPVEEE